jgi:Leucine-rich repeat (LRR) protein
VIPRSFYHIRFDKILILDIRGNEITKLEEEICKNLSSLKKLDARNNKINYISLHVKAMMQLIVLRLDHNELVQIPTEVGEL